MVGGLLAGCNGNGGGTGTGTAEPTGTAEGTGTAQETGTAQGTGTAEGTGTAQGTASSDLDLDENIGNVPQGLEVTNTQLTRVDSDGAGARLTGTIRNTGNQQYEQIEVQATLLDQSNDVLGAWFDNTEGENIETFGSGDEWQFSIDFPQADLGNAAAYRVDIDNNVDNGVWDWGGNGTGTGTGTNT